MDQYQDQHHQHHATTPQELAEACARAMWEGDSASRDLAMKLEHVAPGEAVLSMTVTRSMTNGHGNAHGGYLFTLADSAFAFACNTYNQITVAQNCAITFLAPGTLGDRLTATARERSRSGRSGLYDVQVTREDGKVIAEFRGHSRTVKGTLLSPQGDGV
nr:hydroxyphenylacetyl-CoA thioesterase PaaI [uncultured Cohaesibacter sp.]